MDHMGKSRIRKNLKVWVYPKSMWNSNGDLPPFKKGVFYLAIQIQVSLFPVAHYTFYNPR